jgi:NADH dehydrogenase
MARRSILVVGGSGFIGSQVVSRLAAQGWQVRVPTRRPERARALTVLPGVQLIEAQVQAPGVLDTLATGCDAAVSLVGILHGRRGQPPGWGPDFDRAHVALPARLVEACLARGVSRLVHVSALGVTEGGERTLPSRYLRSKAAGEAVIRAADARGLATTVLRPSVVFGADDAFLRLFAQMQAVLPVVALAGASARFQPIWVDDVAQAVVNALQAPVTHGKAYALAGPEVYTLRELVQWAGAWSGHQRPVLGLPGPLGRMLAWCMEQAPGEPLMTRDNLDSMAIPNTSDTPIAPELGVVPTALSLLGPRLYGPADGARRFDAWREHAGR